MVVMSFSAKLYTSFGKARFVPQLTHPKLSIAEPQPPQGASHLQSPAIMPPRLKAIRLASSLLTQPSRTAVAPLSAPFVLSAQQRAASILSSLSDTKGAYSKRIRRGRGPASGKGKTSGRGQKGQHAHGKVPAGFQGGQTPLEITKPERGNNKYNP